MLRAWRPIEIGSWPLKLTVRWRGVAPSNSVHIEAKASSLVRIKLLHTVIWAFFAGCIVTIPVAAWLGRYLCSVLLIAIVSLEVLVLLFNDWRCPLTNVAGRYTPDRRDNFDIYLPEWLARNNKLIFGALYLCGVLMTAFMWVTH